ncbi:hypothetical protein [Streptomyces sp. WM6378]|uniref:hypothetical protein n=1 Tax=Streptomyces sp. WM6378 TaxID=1415557 RepID=UPI0006AE86DE|nr:hypothetical protein [Streptomyces sp. WM6378]KOU43948.1 hypothetical protein ADK54_17050 [Streptomyces sp. WM6378]
MTNPQHLADALEGEGVLPPQWAKTVRAVDRGLFIPGRTRELDRHSAPQAWLDAVYSDTPVVIQWDDGRPGGHGFPTSSSSKPSVMLETLALADVRPGDRVYELGTGTGYNAALLSEQCGDEQVTTAELDEGLHLRARRNLRLAGYRPYAFHGDGLLGRPQRAPFDKVIGTCTLRTLGRHLLAQTADGGRIVTPYGESFHSYSFLVLDVADGEGLGRFTGNPAFMWARQQRGRMAAIADVYHREQGDTGTTRINPYDLARDADAEFYLSRKVPGAWPQLVHGGEEAPAEATYWLLADDEKSWATVEYVDGRDEFETEQYGPRRLWDEVASVVREFDQCGRPARERFGLTATPEGEFVWLDDPANRITS